MGSCQPALDWATPTRATLIVALELRLLKQLPNHNDNILQS